MIFSQNVRRVCKSILPKKWYPALGECLNLFAGIRKMGYGEYVRLRRLSEAKAGEGPCSFRIPPLLHPIWVRGRTSDSIELIHSVVRNNYAKRLPPHPVGLIIDAGANIGDTTAWYLSVFPEAKVFAVEPDSQNFSLLSRNCAPYGSRAVLLRAGLWPRNAFLRVNHSSSASDVFVEEVPEGVVYDCKGVSPMDILKQSGADQIDIFKCDIEGGERQLFGGDCDDWLSRTKRLFVEIHNAQAKDAVMTAVGRHGFKCETYREIHIFFK